jgi:pimeloyl-ACP methyl ester carboxylesterase
MDLTIRSERTYAYTGGKSFDPMLPTVVFIHGGEQDHSVWILQSRYFAHHGYGVLALDLPGHGRSGGAPLTRIEDMASWIVAVLDAAGIPSAALVGHSMGSLIALDTAARFPRRVSRVALLATAFPMRVATELLEATQKNESAAHDMINIWSHSSYAHYPSNPGPGFWIPGGNLRLMQRQKRGVLHADFAACNNYTAGLESAAKITCPALLLLGRRDAMTPARAAQDMAKAISNAKVVTIEHSGHNLMAEEPDEVLDTLVAFMPIPTDCN